MYQGKIPIINDKFDLAIFIQILRKNYWVALVLLLISFIGAQVYLRYSQPIYSTQSIIQLNESNKTTLLLNIEDVNKSNDISKVIELLRSKEFLKRAFSRLPLEVSYYNEGTFLSTELYKHSPYQIDWKIQSGQLYDRLVYIEFADVSSATITLEEGKDQLELPLTINEWMAVAGDSIRCTLLDAETVINQNNNYKNNRYYFVINNPTKIVETHLNNLQIFLLSNSAQTIQIAYSGFNSEKAANIVNTIAQEYLKYDVEIKKESAENILAFIEERLKVVYHNLGETERELVAFKKDNKINFDKQQGYGSPFPLFTTKMAELEDELINIEFELATLNQINNKVENDNNLNVYELIATLAGTKSEAIVVNVLNNLQELMNRKEQLLNDVTRDNLKIKIIEKQIEGQKQLLKDFVSSTIMRLESKKADYEAKIKEYNDKVFNTKNYDELEYSKLERLYTINEGFYHKLIEKKAEYLISQAGYVSQNTILEKGITPTAPIAPISKKIYPISLFLGLFIGVGYILVRYLLYDEITSISMIQSYTKAPILGTVPIYKKEIPVSQLLVNKQPNSVFSEAFRTIRSNLQFISQGAETKIITLSSTISGEGKTFVAINLAGILAISGKKVILLDLDLRKPRIHLGFNTSNNKGISTLLIGKHKLDECIEKTDMPNFDYITAGPIPPNPSELSSGKQMESLLVELEDRYDIIIIDTPPVGIVTDALVNLQKANYPIYVMKANVSKRHFIENINSLIKFKNMDNLSVILNGVELNAGGYGNYGYGYGYGYYTEDQETTVGRKLTQKLQKLKK